MKGRHGVKPASQSSELGGGQTDALPGTARLTPQEASTAWADGSSWGWLARELHDGVTQDLWYLQAQLSSLANQLPDNCQELHTQVEGLKQVTQAAYQELRVTLGLLKSRSTPYLSLGKQLDRLSQKFSGTIGMQVEFHTSPPGHGVVVSGEVGRQVRLLVQEALWNTWRHSMTDKARVMMRWSEIGLVVTVSDDGCGFDPDKVCTGRYGLRNMRERAESISGRLYVTSRLGNGTRVTLHIPPEGLEDRVKKGVKDGSTLAGR